jgi:endonuclease V-like protein UPF0215 family
MKPVQSIWFGNTTINGVTFETGADIVDGVYIRWCAIDGQRVTEDVFEQRLAAALKPNRLLLWASIVASFLAGYILGHVA